MYAELKVEFDSNEINFQQSSNLQGVLMENISSEYAEKLHGNQLNPYSQCILKEEGKTIWYLKTLNTEAYEMLLLPMTKLDTITLRKKNKTVNLLNKTVRIKEDKELIKEFYENKCSRYLELSFKTPTSFKRDGKYVIYPDLSLIYGSLMRKFSAASEEFNMYDEDTLEELVTQSEIAAIGAVDSPVVKDVKTNLPMIPGSSLKGKMRSLLAKEFNEQITEPKGDHERISRLFGSSEKNKIKRSRLLFSDMVLANEQELREAGLQSMTEVKFENSISRLTAVANPRQIERVVRGSVFELDLIYEMENEQEFIEDMQTLAEGMKLLQYDYLGGSGSRGYGKIQFNNVHAEGVIGNVDNILIDKCNEILKEVVNA